MQFINTEYNKIIVESYVVSMPNSSGLGQGQGNPPLYEEVIPKKKRTTLATVRKVILMFYVSGPSVNLPEGQSSFLDPLIFPPKPPTLTPFHTARTSPHEAALSLDA